jgi:peroxiredoxin
MTEVRAGDVLERREQKTIHGTTVQIPDAEQLTHLQFRRYAGCPICNLHLRSITQRHDEIVAAGIREVVVFHSDEATMRQFQGELPYAAVADPEKKLYAEFGVEKKMSPLESFRPRMIKTIARAAPRAPSKTKMLGIGEEKFNNPADFLIGADGRVIAAKYGEFPGDQWSVDELLGLARAG